MIKVKWIAGIVSVVVVLSLLFFDIPARLAMMSIDRNGILSGKIIVLDAGHGGADGGVTVKNGSIKESDINLRITQKLKLCLESAGAVVILTRSNQDHLPPGSRFSKRNDMNMRLQTINSANADIFISIHVNKFPAAYVHGAQVFCLEPEGQSAQLAQCIKESFIDNLGKQHDRIIKQGDFFVLKNNVRTSVLVECGFISNPEEGALLASNEYNSKVAWVIFNGIMEYVVNVDKPVNV